MKRKKKEKRQDFNRKIVERNYGIFNEKGGEIK